MMPFSSPRASAWAYIGCALCLLSTRSMAAEPRRVYERKTPEVVVGELLDAGIRIEGLRIRSVDNRTEIIFKDSFYRGVTPGQRVEIEGMIRGTEGLDKVLAKREQFLRDALNEEFRRRDPHLASLTAPAPQRIELSAIASLVARMERDGEMSLAVKTAIRDKGNATLLEAVMKRIEPPGKEGATPASARDLAARSAALGGEHVPNRAEATGVKKTPEEITRARAARFIERTVIGLLTENTGAETQAPQKKVKAFLEQIDGILEKGTPMDKALLLKAAARLEEIAEKDMAAAAKTKQPFDPAEYAFGESEHIRNILLDLERRGINLKEMGACKVDCPLLRLFCLRK